MENTTLTSLIKSKDLDKITKIERFLNENPDKINIIVDMENTPLISMFATKII